MNNRNKQRFLLFIFILIILFVSCKKRVDFKIPENTTFTGRSVFLETGDPSYFNLEILENDSFILLQSHKVRRHLYENNIQYYGRLNQIDSFEHHIIPSIHFNAWGCDKPEDNYLKSDSIPIYIDNEISDLIKNYNVEVYTKFELDTTILINRNKIVFPSDTIRNLAFKSTNNSNLKPFHLNGVDLRCGVYIQSHSIRNYFINKYNDGYILIREKLNYKKEHPDFRDTIYLEIQQ